MQNNTGIDAEAGVFSYYLIRRQPSKQQILLYAHALRGNSSVGDTYSAALRHPGLLPYLDAHDAFFNPSSELRQRLYLLFSILEASPNNTELFLPRQHNKGYVLVITMIGFRGVIRLIIGMMITKVKGWA